MVDPAFWRGREVLLTGHTGFKGAWLALWLQALGARVTGVSAAPPSAPSLYEVAGVGGGMGAEIAADVRDFAAVRDAIAAGRPEVVLHLAAQPLVRRSYREPRDTYEVNVMGTVNVLEAVRAAGDGVRAVVVVTSDKCYANDGAAHDFVESDPLGGADPYSSSKAAAELVAEAYRRSFFDSPEGPRLATARAGNVIGGGDWGEDRLVPDMLRAALAGETVRIRNPDAVRPWQHVLNPLDGYLRLAQALCEDAAFAGAWNLGPAREDAQPVRWIAERLAALWPGELRWEVDEGTHPHEAAFLALDSGKARGRLGWAPAWDLEEALGRIVEWFAAWREGRDMRAVSLEQVEAFAAASAVGAT